MALTKANTIGLTQKMTVLGNKNKSKVVVARIDTGAVISSIDLKLAAELGLGPVVRTKKVKNANGMTERPIVYCKFKIKGKTYRAEVTLADRHNLKFRALIGQNLLKKTNFYINPRLKLTE